MQILSLELFGQPLVLLMDENAVQRLCWGEKLVSEVDLKSLKMPEVVHRFELTPEQQSHRISLNMQMTDKGVNYQLWQDDQRVNTGQFYHAHLQVEPAKPKTRLFGLAALAFKLFKSVKLVKVALASASVAGYAWLFSIEFALVLIACLVAHEYGHVKAMQYFGIKTKGIYLIPFVGGLAVADDKINTRWQDVVISIMGPCFGLIMSIACLILYGVTGLELFAGASVIGSLLNLFNLLPILPLDGGHVIKSISFSMRSWIGLSVCTAGILLGAFISYLFGLFLLVFFLIFGLIETGAQWQQRNLSHLLPLDRYGQTFSAVWYVLVLLGHLAVIYAFANSDSAILSLPLNILSQ